MPSPQPSRRHRTLLAASAMTAALSAVGAVAATPAYACGGLVDPNGTIRLGRTSTLVAFSKGVEHYVTSFEYAGAGGTFGSIVPLPARPTKVERAGDWTLQRLAREVAPVLLAKQRSVFAAGEAADAEVVLEAKIDALDITVLKGGGPSVSKWARENNFELSSDAPKMLEFYARRSPYFMAARFNAERAADRGQVAGQGTPVHVEIPLKAPWVPLHILSLGKASSEIVRADVFLLTDREPALLGGVGPVLSKQRNEPASAKLLSDLRSDKNSTWVPEKSWFTYLSINAPAEALSFDLAIDPSQARAPSRVAAGLTLPRSLRFPRSA